METIIEVDREFNWYVSLICNAIDCKHRLLSAAGYCNPTGYCNLGRIYINSNRQCEQFEDKSLHREGGGENCGL